MGSAATPRILLCVEGAGLAGEVASVLAHVGQVVRESATAVAGFHLIVCESDQVGAVVRTRQQTDSFVPILVLAGDHSPAARLASSRPSGGSTSTFALVSSR